MLDPSLNALSGRELSPAFGTLWPVAQPRPGSVLVRYVAGYTAVPESIRQAITLMLALGRPDPFLKQDTAIGVASHNRHRREMADFWRKQAPRMTVQPRPSQSFLHGLATEGGEMGKALKGIVRPHYHPAPPQVEPKRAPIHSTFKRALSSTSPLQPHSPEQIRSAVHAQVRDRSEPTKVNAVRHAGIADRFQGEQAIKRWQRGEIDEIDRRMRDAIEHLREEREDEREQDQRDRDELKAKHEQFRDDARRKMGIPDPNVNERETEQEYEIETDRFGKEVIDMAKPVEPEPSHDEAPPIHANSYAPNHASEPDHYPDFEMGD